MTYAWLLILVPLVSAGVLAYRGRTLSEERIGTQAAGAVGIGFAVAVLLALQWLIAIHSRGERPPLERILVDGATWIAVGELQLRFALLIDPLTLVMCLVVTGVGYLIHRYAVGYLHGDPHFARFFALLNLFVAAMLMLVMADNLAMTFIGWEGVGFCSYMLIGYYTDRHSATQAGKKAFLVNRVGDLGFLLGAFLLYREFGTLRYHELNFEALELLRAAEGDVGIGLAAMIAISLLLFAGACGKSAQFPLHVWLPDAMEGPTPVSALIHAATMVTAGVFLLVRLAAVLALAPLAMNVIAVVGLFTALIAALLALVQHDLKRVLAYSTVSQLGYMFVAVGVGAPVAAIFHLVTHAFFKGLLFLCSGSVIHAVEHALHASGEQADAQDMRHMGGLAGKLPTTYRTMLAGAAAIAGVPLLSGFFSKDEILLHAGHHSDLLKLIGLGVALLTAFYMFRLIFKTFWQTSRLSPAAQAHLAESPAAMTQPLLVLGGLALAGGVLNLPGEWSVSGGLKHFLTVNTHRVEELVFGVERAFHPTWSAELGSMLVGGLVALAGIALAWFIYAQHTGMMTAVAERYPRFYRLLVHLYFLDDLYQRFIVRPGVKLAEWLATVYDQQVIDGLVNRLAGGVGRLAGGSRAWQGGQVRAYALWFVLGAAVTIAWLGLRGQPWPLLALVAVLLVVLVGCAVVVLRPKSEA